MPIPPRPYLFAALAGAALCLGVAASPATPVPQERPADAVARRFLAHLAGNGPVAGEFRVETEIDAARRQQFLPPLPARPGIQVVPEPAKQALVCRWAWAPGREVCQALPGSAGGNLYGLLTLPGGSLLGINDGQYNLTESEVFGAAHARPACFYFLDGGQHWPANLAGAEFGLEPAKGHPPGFVTLVATTAGRRAKLVVGQATGHLREASVYYGDALSWKLVVEELAVSEAGDRAFPKKARTAVYLPGSDAPFRQAVLTASRLDFPTGDDAAKEFHFPVRKGAIIGDRVRNMAILPDAETDAADIITKDLPRVPFSKPGP